MSSRARSTSRKPSRSISPHEDSSSSKRQVPDIPDTNNSQIPVGSNVTTIQGISDDEELDEVQTLPPSRSIWDIEEEMEKKPDDPSFLNPPTSKSKVGKSNYFWCIDKDRDLSKLPPDVNFEVKEYILLCGSLRSAAPKDYWFVTLEDFANYKNRDSELMNELIKAKAGERCIKARSEKGKVDITPAYPEMQKTPNDLVESFTNWQKLSLEKVPTMDMKGRFGFWTQKIGGPLGVTFKPQKGPVLSLPGLDERYVKLAKEDVYTLTHNDPKKSIRYLKNVYIAEATMKMLCGPGSYPWDDNWNMIWIREQSGRGNWLTIGDRRDSNWWVQAWIDGLKKQDGKPVRSRNVGGLKMLFAITNGGREAGLSKESLTDLIHQAKTKALILIKQDATVVSKWNKAEFTEQNKTYDYLASISPFGDYETWIRKKDYISYLTSYPGHPLPQNTQKDDLKGVFQALKPKPEARRDNDDFRTRLGKSYTGRISLTDVTSKTVVKAGLPNARKDVPTQQRQMGGSATKVATLLGWPYAKEMKRIPAESKLGLNWDAPGHYAAEWLHRAAFSWGSTKGNDVTSAKINLVFGCGEANGLMTRFEKSWQRLFLKEREYQKALRKVAGQTYEPKELSGVLSTTNTADEAPVVETRADGDNIVRDIWRKENGTITKQTITTNTFKNTVPVGAVAQPGNSVIDYWKWVDEVGLGNLSFTLDYRLNFPKSNSIRSCALLHTIFHPFQRGFFTRLEAEVDFLLLEKWKDAAVGEESIPPPPVTVQGYSLPSATIPAVLADRTSGQTFNQTAGLINNSARNKFFRSSSPVVASTLPHSALPQGEVWRAAVSGKAIEAGGAHIKDLTVISTNERGIQIKVPLNGDQLSDAPPTGRVQALIATNPQTTTSPPRGSNEAATLPITIDTPNGFEALANGDAIPNTFVLSGTIKLFGLFEENIYSYHGDATSGLCQIVPLAPGTVKLSDYIPSLAGSEIEAVQMSAVQFRYNQYTTATAQRGTWLQADVLFSGPLQKVSDLLHNVFHQDKPLLRLEAQLSSVNDWSRPLSPSSFGFRGSLPGISLKVGDLVEFTDLGLSISIGHSTEMWPPYKERVLWGIGFFGSCRLDMPNDMMPLALDFMLDENDGMITLMLSARDTVSNFFGITGLHLSDLGFRTSFAIDSTPSSLVLTASASIHLRETSLQLSGSYTKGDWGFICDLEDFDFASIRDLYEDIFGSPLHVSDHEIVVKDLLLEAGSSGIAISGSVTIEGYTSTKATISISSLGVSIQGQVEDIHLAKDVILKQASLDIFIGPSRDTTLDGPGTSYKFAINGTVSIGNIAVSASLFIGKDPTGNVIWTVYGGFQNSVNISKIAPELQGTFLDFPLESACIIASNTDDHSAAGNAIPSYYPIVKGVQVAARLDRLPLLDQVMNNRGASTTGLTLQAMYAEESSTFKIGINLSTPQKVSMKGSTVRSGDVSLQIEVSATPSMMLKADFFVQVANQEEPLKFSGGIKANVSEAEAFIEIANQWWTNPFGLSPRLKLGPNLALQIGIVYAGPVYPSEIGIAAGLGIGSASGKAALSISETPSDELIMLKVDNLGVTDLAAFASDLFEVSLPTPEDFLRFKDVEFYLSSGTTIGTVIYPAGASFSCDAVIFGKEATIYCGVEKAKQLIAVKGSLDPIDVGPLVISGTAPGTKAKLDVEIGSSVQSVYINGAIRIGDIDAAVDLHANFLPNVTFDLKTDLDFSTHLTFQLQATMRHGSFTTLSSLESLDFDIYCLLRQDILDYIATQVNMQIMAAKHSVDDGIHAAEDTLNKAQEKFNADIGAAQNQVDNAKRDYEAKAAAVNGALAAETTSSALKMQKLTQDVQAAIQAFNNAVDTANQNLQTASQNRDNEIRAAQANVDETKRRTDNDIDNHIKQVNDARNDMQNRFGNALNDVQNAQNQVNGCQSAVDSAQRDYDNAVHDLNNCDWWEKVPKTAAVTAAGIRLGAVKAGLAAAQQTLNAANAIVSGPGYSAAKASIDFYEADLDAARRAADAAMIAANATLAQTINTQNALVSAASSALTAARTTDTELQDRNVAENALAAFQVAETTVLQGLQSAVDGLAGCAEKIAFDAAQAALNIAQANVKDVDVAKAAVQFAQEAGDAVLDAGNWLASHALNILNLRMVEISGDLRGLCKDGSRLNARVVGTFAEGDVDFHVGFLPGKREEMVKDVFEKLMNDVKGGILRIGG